MVAAVPRLAAILACALAAAGCSSSNEAPPVPRPKLPVVEDFGGPRMAHPDLVTVTFADDADRDALDAYGSWIVGSTWLVTVGNEYGVGDGSTEAPVHRAENAPDAITDDQVVDMLYAGLADGSIPAPSSGDLSQTLYLFHFPTKTIVTAGSTTSCTDFNGYHASARRAGKEVAYAVVADCPSTTASTLTDLQRREITTSHELIEAATDPVPGNRPAFRLARTDPWRVFGVEVADLCERADERGVWREGTNVAQKSWSNVAAKTGDPCVPNAPLGPYFNVGTTNDVTPRVSPGSSTTVELVGWSTGAVGDWEVQAAAGGAVKPTLSFSSSTINDGRTTKLTVGIPADAAPGSAARIVVFSAHSFADYNAFPLGVVVGEPCSSFTSCGDCATHAGCGWCASNARCERSDGHASVESDCKGDAFATWSGACTGFCAGHGGSCSDCATQFGCGWCGAGAGGCHEAASDFSVPNDAACDNASWSFDPSYCP